MDSCSQRGLCQLHLCPRDTCHPREGQSINEKESSAAPSPPGGRDPYASFPELTEAGTSKPAPSQIAKRVHAIDSTTAFSENLAPTAYEESVRILAQTAIKGLSKPVDSLALADHQEIADLSDSSLLSQNLSPEEWQELMKGFKDLSLSNAPLTEEVPIAHISSRKLFLEGTELVLRNPQKAFYCFVRSADLGDSEALVALSILLKHNILSYKKDTNQEKKNNQIKLLLEKAAKKGNAHGALRLGVFLFVHRVTYRTVKVRYVQDLFTSAYRDGIQNGGYALALLSSLYYPLKSPLTQEQLKPMDIINSITPNETTTARSMRNLVGVALQGRTLEPLEANDLDRASIECAHDGDDVAYELLREFMDKLLPTP